MHIAYTVTAADHAELTAETARLESEWPAAVAARDEWEARMDGTQKFDWERRLYGLNRAVSRIEKRLLDIDQFLVSSTIAPDVEQSTPAAA